MKMRMHSAADDGHCRYSRFLEWHMVTARKIAEHIELVRQAGHLTNALRQTLLEAGMIRFKPIVLTAAAAMIGAAVILTDPIFQGLAISLMAGEVASLLLSRVTVPVLYYLGARHSYPAPSGPDPETIDDGTEERQRAESAAMAGV